MRIPFASLAPALQAASGPQGVAAPVSPKAQAERRKLESAQAAAATLAAAAREQNDSVKARAREKVRRLKEELQRLKMLFQGDPKGLAKMAARLARELGAAVKEYSAAGGAIGDLGAVNSAAPGAEGGQVQEAGDAQAGLSPEEADHSPEGGKPEAATLPDGYRDPLARAREQSRHEDAEFAAEARALAQQLKAILRGAKGDRKNEDERKAAESSLVGVEQMLSVSGLTGAISVGAGAVLSISA
jgi:hypothetical protein